MLSGKLLVWFRKRSFSLTLITAGRNLLGWPQTSGLRQEGTTMDESRFSRRNFLSNAAFSAVAVTQGGRALRTPQHVSDQPSSSLGDAMAFEGTLQENSKGRLALEVENELRVLPLGAAATLWRGGEKPLTAFRLGDRVLIRSRGGAIERAWANLTRWKGSITATSTRGYIAGAGGKESLELVIDSATRFEDAFTGQAIGPPASLKVGDAVDVIALDLDRALLASVIRYEASSPPRSGSQPVTPPRLIKSGVTPDIQCHLHYTGFASWFDCCTGCGRCGTCSTGRSDQTAWPAMDTCNCCSPTCCDCGKNCSNSPGWYLPCGYAVIVTDACNGHYKTTFIADCGPCNNPSCHTKCQTATCSHTCSLCTSRTTPVIDLTKPTFALFHDPSSYGCFPCDAEIVVAC